MPFPQKRVICTVSLICVLKNMKYFELEKKKKLFNIPNLLVKQSQIYISIFYENFILMMEYFICWLDYKTNIYIVYNTYYRLFDISKMRVIKNDILFYNDSQMTNISVKCTITYSKWCLFKPWANIYFQAKESDIKCGNPGSEECTPLRGPPY